jgi:hypothetical protein
LSAQNGTARVQEKNWGMPEKQCLVGNLDFLLFGLVTFGGAEVCSGHIDCGTKSATYVDVYMQNVNRTGVAQA